ncbi:VWA domain-containing protein [Methylomonas sp. SURF-2]|uniref:VWA domain-containing protein n=1 Tax=Methylomonas subterranea TaxID=2952225 RepID=A0ABT1TGE7_9GAMM|nr:vWA domain-containing protein [Methylomonas sp. SURF-2]MCQ8104394.1 VWA domain-containing protein [Methylomonas sp. SURF-2]
MSALAFETPWALAGLLLALLPLWRSGMQTAAYPWLAMLPPDPLSQAVMLLIRLVAMAAIAALVLGLSGMHLREQSVERIGHGAHIVMLLDRSSSMDNSFAGKAPSGSDDGRDAGGIPKRAQGSTQGAVAEESKAAAARRLLTEFVDHRDHDLIGIAEYSTSPLFVMPLTGNRAAIHAAIAATATPALAYTNISKGLAMALSFFDRQAVQGSRILLLVSDGAAAIDPDSEAALRILFKQQQVRLYWLFLRTDNSPGIFAQPDDPRDDNAQAMPELYLHRFFSSLRIPYQAYEAENPGAMQKAIADIDRLEQLPLHYREAIPKQDLSGLCYGLAAVLMALLLGAKLCEARMA